MTQDGSGYTYTFDDENHLTLATGMTGGPYCYVYDGNGLRDSSGKPVSVDSVNVTLSGTPFSDAC